MSDVFKEKRGKPVKRCNKLKISSGNYFKVSSGVKKVTDKRFSYQTTPEKPSVARDI